MGMPNQTAQRLMYGYLRDGYRDVALFPGGPVPRAGARATAAVRRADPLLQSFDALALSTDLGHPQTANY